MQALSDQWSGDALTLASRANHDMRSPLGAIETTTELLAELLQGDSTILNLVRNIENSAAQALGILDHLSTALRASYGERPPSEPVATRMIADIAVTKLSSLARERGTSVAVDGSWPEIVLVPDWLLHLLTLLLDNAIRHGGRQVRLVASTSSGSMATFLVEDDGPGFPPARLADPFPAFEKLHALPGFSGLGLAIAGRFASLLGATLDHQRTSGGITRITLTFRQESGNGSCPGPLEGDVPFDPDLAALERPHDPHDFDTVLALTRRFLAGRAACVVLPDETECHGHYSGAGLEAERAFAETASAEVVGTGRRITRTSESSPPLAFAGVPLYGMDPKRAAGCLCVVDLHPREWTEEEITTLADFGSLTEKELRLREKRRRLAHALRRLRIDEEFNHSLVEGSSDCIKLLDPEGRILFMNGPGLFIMEIDDFASVRGSIWTGFWPEDSRHLAEEALQQAVQGGTGHFQALCPTAKGTPRWWDVAVSGIRGGSGRIERILATSRDITASKQAEIAVRTSEQTLRKVLDRIFAFAGLLTPEGIMLEINAAALEVAGARLEEVVGHCLVDGPWWRHSEKERLQIAADIKTAAAGNPVRRTATALTSNGRVIDVEISLIPILDENGTVTHLVPSGVDLTPRLEAERLGRESERRFRLLADNMSQFAWITEADGNILWYNQRWFDYTGTTREDVRGWGWQQVHHPDHLERVAQKFREHLDSQTPWEDTFPLRGKDGEYRWFLSRAIPVRNEAGEVVQWFGTNTDITRLLEVEQALRKASQAKDDFIAVLSHELRTPLNPVLLISSAAAARGDLPEDVKRDFDIIRKNIEMEARLIDDLLDMTRILRGKLPLVITTVTVDSLLAETLSVLHNEASAKGIVVETDLQAHHVCLQGDEIRLRQILWNVMRNAVKFTPAGGRIKVTTRADESRFTIQIADSGVGIDAEELTRIFDPFVQGARAAGLDRQRYGGLGLGLAIAKLLVEQHGGSITASSEGPGTGTLVTIHLPLSTKTPAIFMESRTDFTDFSSRKDGSPLRVLLIEDHDATRETLAMLLRSRGHEVIEAGCLADGYKAAQDGRYDLMISDIGLPDGRGDELLTRLRGEGFPTPAIALSGYGMEPDVERSRQAGYSQHLTKPVSIGDLDRALARVRARGGGSQAG